MRSTIGGHGRVAGGHPARRAADRRRAGRWIDRARRRSRSSRSCISTSRTRRTRRRRRIARTRPYDGEIAYADELVGRLLDRLQGARISRSRDRRARVRSRRRPRRSRRGRARDPAVPRSAARAVDPAPARRRRDGGRASPARAALVDVAADPARSGRPRRRRRSTARSLRSRARGAGARSITRLFRDALSAAAFRLERSRVGDATDASLHPRAAPGAVRSVDRPGRAPEPGGAASADRGALAAWLARTTAGAKSAGAGADSARTSANGLKSLGYVASSERAAVVGSAALPRSEGPDRGVRGAASRRIGRRAGRPHRGSDPDATGSCWRRIREMVDALGVARQEPRSRPAGRATPSPRSDRRSTIDPLKPEPHLALARIYALERHAVARAAARRARQRSATRRSLRDPRRADDGRRPSGRSGRVRAPRACRQTRLAT